MNMISAHHNYDNGYISLVKVEVPNLPKTLKVDGYELQLKSELHASLICAKRIAPLIDETKADEIEAEIVTFFLEFIKQTPLTDYSLTNKYRLVKRDERVTVVVMIEVPGVEQLFDELQKKYNTKLPLQPTHITLYTLQPEAGIGILSEEQLERDSEPVEVSLHG